MLIRAATLADIPVLMSLERESPSAGHWPRHQYELAVGSAGRQSSVVEEDSQVVGFIVSRIAGPEWEIENLVVRSDHRRLGLGLALLEAVFQSARQRGAEAIFLEVRESNQEARRLYENSGFAQIGRRPNYYHEPEEDALTYRRQV